MAESVYRHFFAKLAYIASIGNLYAFGYGDHDRRFLCCKFLNVFHELVHVKYFLRQIDRIRSAAVVSFG